MGLGSVFSWIGAGLKKVFSFLLSNTDVNKFLSDFGPIALDVVENVAKLDLDGDGKKGKARGEILGILRARGVEYRDRYINLLIEMALAELTSKGKA